jgi:hypothetical protein
MVRMRSRTGSNATLSWDSFGKAEVRERRRAGGSSVDLVGAAGSLSRELSTPDLPLAFSGPLSATPKQSLEDGGWQIRYTRTMARDGARSRSASREPGTAVVPEGEATHATSRARPIPSRPRTPAAPAATPASVSGSGSTARSRTPHSLGTRRMSDIAAIAALRVGSPCAPVVSTEHASPRECRSIPRAGFNWNEATHRTYELPAGVVVNPNKGLFYFKA